MAACGGGRNVPAYQPSGSLVVYHRHCEHLCNSPGCNCGAVSLVTAVAETDKTVCGTGARALRLKAPQHKEAMEDTALETLRLIYEARRSQAQPQSWGYPCAGEAGGPVPSASEVPPSLIAASPAPSALTAPMVMAYGALAHSQHSLAVAAALMSAPAVTAPMATYAPVAHSQQAALQFTEASPAPPIAYPVPAAPVCAVRPPLMKVWDELPRPRSSAPYKRPAQPTKKPAAPAKKAYSNAYTRFCQEQRPLLPRSLCNTEREKTLGRMWKTHRLDYLEAEKNNKQQKADALALDPAPSTAAVDSLLPGAAPMEDSLLQEQLARLRGSWSRESHAADDVVA